jgi:hypothetical protein
MIPPNKKALSVAEHYAVSATKNSPGFVLGQDGTNELSAFPLFQCSRRSGFCQLEEASPFLSERLLS